MTDLVGKGDSVVARRDEIEAEKHRRKVREQLLDADALRQALAANRQWLDRTTAPTNVQTLAQIDRLTRQVSTLLRLVGGQVHADLLDD
jgi:adenylylsulfate kinase-like enzyme